MEEILAKSCLDCGKPLKGRSDKRFCNDSCRNNFNGRKRRDEQVRLNEQTPEIFRIIKKNYQLLKACKPPQLDSNGYIFGPLSEMLELGFDPKFCTSVLERDGETWKFCFECGFRISEGYIAMAEHPEQAAIDKQPERWPGFLKGDG